MFYKVFDILPGFVWAIIVAVLLASNVAGIYMLNSEQAEHGKTKVLFADYKLDVTNKARAAEAERRSTELASFRNSERVQSEQAKRDEAAAAERATLRRERDSLRNAVQGFRAGIAHDSASGNVAGLTAKADTAVQLHETCSERYSGMAEEAEPIRLQAIGLLDYIRGNPQCSTPFGDAVPDPSK